MKHWMVDHTASRTVEGMIMSLAGVCDGAHKHDAQGFSGADTEFGHSLAQRAQQGRAYTVKQAQGALKLVNKYRRQLGGEAVVQAFLVNPVFKAQPYDPAAAPAPEASPNNKPADRELVSKDTLAVFKFRYDPELVAAMKTIRGSHGDKRFYASWDPQNKVWTVPVNTTSIWLIMDVAERFRFSVEERFNEYVRKIQTKTSDSRMMLALNGGQNIVVDDGMITIAIADPDILKEFQDALAS